MIAIKRVEYAYAELDCSMEEWECLKAMVKWAFENYDRTILDHIIPAKADKRMSKLGRLCNMFVQQDLRPPEDFHYCDLHLLLIVVGEIDCHGYEIEEIDPKALDSVLKQIGNSSAKTVFPDLPHDMWYWYW